MVLTKSSKPEKQRGPATLGRSPYKIAFLAFGHNRRRGFALADVLRESKKPKERNSLADPSARNGAAFAPKL